MVAGVLSRSRASVLAMRASLMAVLLARGALAAFLVCVAVPSAMTIQRQAGRDPVAAFERDRQEVLRRRADGGCVPTLPVAYGYPRPTEFVADSISR